MRNCSSGRGSMRRCGGGRRGGVEGTLKASLGKLRSSYVAVAAGILLFLLIVSNFWPDLGLNLFSEAAGVVVTIFVIDRILKHQERKRLTPVLKAIERDAHQIAGRITRILMRALESNLLPGEDALIESCDGMWDSRLSAVYDRFDANTVCNVMQIGLPHGAYMQWSVFLPTEVAPLRSAVQGFLERYSAIAPPDLVEAVHAIENTLEPLNQLGPHLRQFSKFSGLFQPIADTLEPLSAALNALRSELAMPSFDATSEEVRRGLGEHVRMYPARTATSPWRP